VYLGVSRYGWDRHIWDVNPTRWKSKLCSYFVKRNARDSVLGADYTFAKDSRLKSSIFLLYLDLCSMYVDHGTGSAKVFYSAALCFGITASLVRLSLLFFYYRLIAHVHIKRYVWLLHILVFVSTAVHLSYFFSVAFMCL
jgi:hypothetical protein